jgi:hypothetical protein
LIEASKHARPSKVEAWVNQRVSREEKQLGPCATGLEVAKLFQIAIAPTA